MIEHQYSKSTLQLYLFFLLLPLWLQPLSAQGIATLIDHHLQDLPDGTECSIGIIDQGEITKLGYRIENQRLIAVQNETRLFEIGSVTKTFTASLIMKMVREGKMALSDPIRKYLPVKMARDSFEGKSITVQHLLMHTSGLSDGPASATWPYLWAAIFSPKNPHRNLKTKHYYRYLKKFKLDYVPGIEWEYNNAAYGLLGEFIKMGYGTSWEEAVKQHLFIPLGMKHSDFEMNRSNKKAFAAGITAKGKKAKAWDMQLINPAGAIKSTLNDMLRYASAQLYPPADELGFIRAAQNPAGYQVKMPEGKLWEGNAMGLGWWHNLEDPDHPFIWHGGASGGYTAFVGFSREEDRAVVILSNISSSHPKARGARRIPKPMLLGQELMRLN